MNYLTLLKFALPEAVVTVTALGVLGIHSGRARWRGLCEPVAILGLLTAAAAVIALPAKADLFGGMLVASPLNALFKIVCLGFALCAVAYVRGERLAHYGEYIALLLFATIGLMLIVSSQELLMIFIGLELTSLPLYVLTAFNKTDRRSAEAGLKYFLFGSTASAFILFGLSLVYGMCGTTVLDGIREKVATQAVTPLLAAGVVMILAGLAFKIAAAPFHLWAADAYEGSPAPTAAFIASGSKVAAFLVLGRILLFGFGSLQGNAGGLIVGWSSLLALLAALSIIVGNITALAQKSLSRLLGYSAVAHAGYTLFGLIVAQRDGFTATLFYTVIYGFTLVGAFGVVAVVRQQIGAEAISDFAGLRMRSPLLATCMAAFLLSLAGLPPLAGFFGKFYLFAVAMREHGMLWLVVVGLAGSLVSVYYYLGIIRTMFVEAPPAEVKAIRVGWIETLLLSVLGGVVLILGLFPDLLLSRIQAGF
jgi:NADH-quinone oxidoreductase subunit N